MTGLPLQGRTIDLTQLQAELAAAGIMVTALGADSLTVYTYDGSGRPADLPAAAAAVLAAHVPSTVGKDQLVALLGPLVGVTVVNLTQAQRLQLLVGLAVAVGAIDRRTLTVQPLANWLLH